MLGDKILLVYKLKCELRLFKRYMPISNEHGMSFQQTMLPSQEEHWNQMAPVKPHAMMSTGIGRGSKRKATDQVAPFQPPPKQQAVESYYTNSDLQLLIMDYVA